MFLFLVACDLGTIQGETGQVELVDADFVVGAFENFSSAGPVEVGSELCPEINCVGCGESSTAIDDCWELSTAGLTETDDCYGFDTLGNASMTWTAVECDTITDAEDDVLNFVVVDGLGPRLEFPYAEAALQSNEDTEAGLRHHEQDAFPEDVLPGDHLLILDGSAIRTQVVLEHDELGLAAFNPSAHELTVEGGTVLEQERNNVLFSADGEGSILFDSEEIGTFATLSPEMVVSLEIHAGIFADEDSESPLAARAIARDADGNQVFGVPVEWSIEDGTSIAVAPVLDQEGDESSQTVFLSDACIEPDGSERTSLLVARWEDLEASAELTWQSAEADPDWEAGEDCLEVETTGCSGGCTAGPAAPGLAALLLGLAVTRRRKRQN
ncbi:MAG TPA: hypothetical protein QGF58_00455 [Myxococcota bacterium]|nr:hypothetical protein [Myxococcota bacterium]